jgi:hypothetical protein
MKKLVISGIMILTVLLTTFLCFALSTSSCNSGPAGLKKTLPEYLNITGSISGLKDEADPITIHTYNEDTGMEEPYISKVPGNGPFEIGIRSPKEGDVYTLIAEAEGYTVQPESYKIRIMDDNAAVITNTETGEEALHLDFHFIPESPPAPLPPGPGTPGAAYDDIVSAPGGFTYRATIHQQGQPDWPPVQRSETALSTPLGYIGIGYRSYIETLAGETRNNIIYLDANNAPEIADPIQVDYHPVGLPDGITLVRGMQGYGGIGGQDRKSSRVVLVIHIASQVKRGEYPFAIQLEYEGEIFGSLTVTVKVK